MSNLLKHPGFGDIRVEKNAGEFVFCAKDVCDALDLANTNRAVQGLDDDEKLTLTILTSGQKREMVFVTESGLYALVMRSNKPQARVFRKWITAEVLPALRKYGTYSIDPKMMERAERKLAERKTGELLREIGGKLSATDKRIVAAKCRTDEFDVNQVLSGRVKDAYMLAQLYSTATGNTMLQKQFYTAEGAEHLLEKLRNVE